MNKLDMESKDIVNENIEKISELFPNVIVESEKGKSIDFDLLKQELSKEIVEGNKEKYQLTWPGKKEAILNANTPCNKTLRPVKEKSVDFENTKNIYIEGDNLEVLKILQESYINKIDIMYIDPPYNTGNDFIYNDKFISEDELIKSGQLDEYNNRLITNNESNGKYHSDWISMMYSRLKLARNLLNDNGMIFISIDDREVANLIKICDEIFDSKNFENFIWKKKGGAGNTEKIIGCLTEYVLCYFKNKKAEIFNYQKFEREYKYEDENGKYNLEGIEKTNLGTYARPTMLFPIVDPETNTKFYPSQNMRWTLGEESVKQKISEGRIVFNYEKNKVYLKKREENYEESKNVYYNLLLDCGSLATAKDELNDLFGNRELFSTPKPTQLLLQLLKIASKKESLIMDFFSGSATMADAVMKLNLEDNGNRKYILVQLPEKCDISSEAFSLGFDNICDIGEERIRKVAKKIKEKNNNLDCGVRVYKVDSSNMKDVYYSPDKIKQENLFDYVSNIKEDRNAEDLLTQVILDLGLTLDLKIDEKNILNNKVYFVDENSLIACFDNEIDINIVDEICKYNPLKVVFKDESFKTDNDKINLQERFKKLLPNTEVNVI